ncbi:F-box/LRR-repeat protein 2 [Chaetomidium leptoderma]|uniref:F-box/LRR-repeat protein 2 n=1 Tax=Chaetomidium leptoderma TaxID=669021 RepID=A0AAN7A1W0_9PEZI|nr:F-box/LRR-repeat protein 2 [Chaetomidium leptoderma]
MADLEITQHVPSMSPNVAVPDDILTGDGGPENGIEPQLKMRGRDRLLRGLQRMSSSPSLARVGRSRSASSPYSVSGTLSCVSLASTASPFGQPSAGSYFSQASAGTNSSAHTSIPASPIAESPVHEGLESVLPIRPVDCAAPVSTTASLRVRVKERAKPYNLWAPMPRELKVYVLSFLPPKELVRASRVSKEFHKMCFDGQLWTSLDASEFYREIPAESLAKIIVSAGPFVKDLNLRGCLQVEHYQRAEVMVKACQNLINATLEGCRNFKRSTLHSLLKTNGKLAHLNLTGLSAVNNATCKIVANSCPQLEVFNVSWCKHMDARGIKFVVEACPKLKDLRVGEIKGFNNTDLAEAIFRTNNLERLVLTGCDDLTDAALQTMIQGLDPEIDYLTDRPIVPPRKLRHLDLARCTRLTDDGVKALGHFVPDLEGLQLSGVKHLTDVALEPILASTPRLTHLELEDLSDLTNALLSQHLAKAPCARGLEHLGISYCESLGDAGMLPVLRNCVRLRSVYMDNTRVSDLALAEAAAMVRARGRAVTSSTTAAAAAAGLQPVVVGLNLVVYDCSRVTWTGVREVLSRNAAAAAAQVPSSSSLPSLPPLPPQPQSTAVVGKDNDKGKLKEAAVAAEVIGLRCYYGWQMTVDEHTKRVLRGDTAAAGRLERKWAEYMQANEEAGAVGAGGRRRRRRAREAQMVHIDEEGGGGAGGGGGGGGGGDGGDDGGGVGAGGRRRARTTACVVM